MDWQKLKMLLNAPLVLLEKVVKKEIEGPRQGDLEDLRDCCCFWDLDSSPLILWPIGPPMLILQEGCATRTSPCLYPAAGLPSGDGWGESQGGIGHAILFTLLYQDFLKHHKPFWAEKPKILKP